MVPRSPKLRPPPLTQAGYPYVELPGGFQAAISLLNTTLTSIDAHLVSQTAAITTLQSTLVSTLNSNTSSIEGYLDVLDTDLNTQLTAVNNSIAATNTSLGRFHFLATALIVTG